MIKASEIRQGNKFYAGSSHSYLCTCLTICQHVMDTSFIDTNPGASPIPPDGIHGYGQVSYEEAEPVTLTEAWLVKFGFADTNGGYRATGAEIVYAQQFKRYNMRLWRDWPDAWVFEFWGDRKLKYVHELQNLWFGLTGEELTTKEPIC